MFNKIKSLFNLKNKKKPISFSVKSLDDLKYFNYSRKIFSLTEKENIKFKSMLVGGCVRKLIKGEEINDIDIATNIEPKILKKILVRNNFKFIETGVEHGTITILINDLKFEVTTLRKDIKTDGRHADVEFISDWEKDAERRDFTINAIYSNLRGETYDPLNGIEDLKLGIIKFVGNPDKRIKEDYLRILRYIRFFTQYSKYEHQIENIKAIKINLKNFNRVSKNRSLDELFKILKLKQISKLFKNEFSNFVILSIFPQLKYGSRLYFLERLRSSHFIEKLSPNLILSVLLIDKTDNAEFFLYKYNLSNKLKKQILFINKIYQLNTISELMNKKYLIQLCYLNGKKNVIDLLLFLIFIYSSKKKKIEDLKNYIDNSLIPVFPIKADYLIDNFNFTEGKLLGIALKKLENKWINDNFKLNIDEIKDILKI